MAFLQLNVYNRIPLILDKQARVSSTEAINFSNKFSADTENNPVAKATSCKRPAEGSVYHSLAKRTSAIVRADAETFRWNSYSHDLVFEQPH